MAKLTTEGIDELINGMNKLLQDAKALNRGALGEGASAAATTYKEELESLPIRPDKPQHGRKLYGVTESEKSQLKDNFGIARFRSTGYGYDTSIGVHGYINTRSPKYGDQVPAKLLLAAVNNGSDFRRPTHTLNVLERKIKGPFEEAVKKYIDEKIADTMN